MPYNIELAAELNILTQFSLQTTHEGLKVHSTAEPMAVAAARRLFEKGITTQPDGGYLTEIGRAAAEHTQNLLLLLKG
ncbi:MAG: TIGR02647 family protein [Pseudomonadales bacterium]|nr:TIGR02647 family protein [Pseudomonadales bacterium]